MGRILLIFMLCTFVFMLFLILNGDYDDEILEKGRRVYTSFLNASLSCMMSVYMRRWRYILALKVDINSVVVLFYDIVSHSDNAV